MPQKTQKIPHNVIIDAVEVSLYSGMSLEKVAHKYGCLKKELIAWRNDPAIRQEAEEWHATLEEIRLSNTRKISSEARPANEDELLWHLRVELQIAIDSAKLEGNLDARITALDEAVDLLIKVKKLQKKLNAK